MADGKGCGIVAVVGIFMLVIGVAIGGGAVFWLYVQKPVLDAPPPDTTTPATAVEAPAVDDRYAVLYPLDQTLRIEGPLPEKEVRDKLLTRRFELRKCYQTGLEKNPDLKGEMSLQFTVAGSNGKVTAAVERHTNFSDAAVRDCILNEVRAWTFSGKQPSQSVVKFDVLMLSMSAAEAQP